MFQESYLDPWAKRLEAFTLEEVRAILQRMAREASQEDRQKLQDQEWVRIYFLTTDNHPCVLEMAHIRIGVQRPWYSLTPHTTYRTPHAPMELRCPKFYLNELRGEPFRQTTGA